jgi:DNA-binding response OmpR family regulator
MRILIASLDAAMAGALGRLLRETAAQIEITAPGFPLMRALLDQKTDLLLLEICGEDGLELLGAVRESAPLCGVLVLSERASPTLRSRWLESGADDCLAKPFSLSELRARCRALLRRQNALDAVLCLHAGSEDAGRGAEQPPTLTLGSLELHRVRRQGVCEGVAVQFTDREASLLGELMLADGAVVSRKALREAFVARQYNAYGGPEATANVVDVHVAAVRRKLQECATAPTIETVRGLGYRMAVERSAPIPAALCSPRVLNGDVAMRGIGR